MWTEKSSKPDSLNTPKSSESILPKISIILTIICLGLIIFNNYRYQQYAMNNDLKLAMIIGKIQHIEMGKSDYYSRRKRDLSEVCSHIKENCPSNGLRGLPGLIGPNGSQGRPGFPGIDGSPGEQGMKGDRGLPGLDGINGARGERGERGLQGIPGLPGVKGQRGFDAEKGQKGEAGPMGIPGPIGPSGAI